MLLSDVGDPLFLLCTQLGHQLSNRRDYCSVYGPFIFAFGPAHSSEQALLPWHKNHYS